MHVLDTYMQFKKQVESNQSEDYAGQYRIGETQLELFLLAQKRNRRLSFDLVEERD